MHETIKPITPFPIKQWHSKIKQSAMQKKSISNTEISPLFISFSCPFESTTTTIMFTSYSYNH